MYDGEHQPPNLRAVAIEDKLKYEIIRKMTNQIPVHIIPEGYTSGMDRSEAGRNRVSHLYRGTFAEPGNPMCQRGWNRADDRN